MATFFRSLLLWLRPSIDALLAKNITFAQRWRMLFFLQPVVFLTYSIAGFPWLLSRAFTVEFLPIAPGRSVRALIFESKAKKKDSDSDYTLRPLHLDVHGGGFMGGLPESDARFCDLLARETGAVVISTTYRYAPPNSFPAAIDDIDAVVRYLHANARERWGADPELMTTSGFSAGGNLAVAASQQDCCHPPAKTALKASVTFYGVMDLRFKPEEKPKPAHFPKKDPAVVLFPLMDAYAAPARAVNMDNPRLSPIVSKLETLPENMLLVVPAIDILVHEQLTFVERVKEEIERDLVEGKKGRRVEALVIEKGFHGWVECKFLFLEFRAEELC
jgi:acetyl esterase/lipase